MSIKDKLAKKTEGMVPLESGLVKKASDIPPRTAPGQMLAFRTELANHTDKVATLENELAGLRGAPVVMMLSPHSVSPSSWANRHSVNYEAKDFTQLKLEIEATGRNIQPIKVRPKKGQEGAFEIVYGHRRHRACLELGLAVAAIVEPLDDQQLFAEMDRENRLRKDLSAWEQGAMYKRALSSGLFSSLRQMAAALGVDAGNASKAIAIANLPDEVIEAFHSPLDIRYRFGSVLEAAIALDSAGVIARAKSSKGQNAARTPSQVLSFLISGATSVSKTTKVRHDIGEISLEFPEGRFTPSQLVEIKAFLKSLITT
jgi:ParB family transcriptional regulator, chromosome partitioning protein